MPSCLSAPIVKFLIKQGIEAATQYKEHYRLKTVAPSEMQQQLAKAKYRQSQLQTLDQSAFATELEIAKAEITTLEEKLGTSPDADCMSVDPAPGMESTVLSKLSSTLSRHQKAIAREQEEHVQLVTSLEAQVAEIQLQISTAQRQHIIQSAAKEELLVGIKTEVDALTVTPQPTKVTEAQNINAHTEVKEAAGQEADTRVAGAQRANRAHRGDCRCPSAGIHWCSAGSRRKGDAHHFGTT